MVADAKPSTPDHGANEPLPAAAVAANRCLFPGFRQSFIRTEGVEVRGRKASGAVIDTLVGGMPSAWKTRPNWRLPCATPLPILVQEG